MKRNRLYKWCQSCCSMNHTILVSAKPADGHTGSFMFCASEILLVLSTLLWLRLCNITLSNSLWDEAQFLWWCSAFFFVALSDVIWTFGVKISELYYWKQPLCIQDQLTKWPTISGLPAIWGFLKTISSYFICGYGRYFITLDTVWYYVCPKGFL